MTPVRFLFVLLVLGCQSVLTNPISNIRVFQTDAVPVREDLKLPPNILSRFDLVFVLLDRPNEQMDKMLSEHVDRKEIYVYPFALNPEGANPSGSVNFSKVSHAKLSIAVDGFAPSATTADVDDWYQVDVYGLFYNWLAIKDGRALLSFA